MKLATLEDMRIGWQKVADRYQITIYVFHVGGEEYQAVSNKMQGVGKLIDTIEPANNGS